MLDKVYYDHEPTPIHIESHDGYADIWLAKNIHEETSEEGTAWVADEVYGKITENIPTKEEIESDFHIWFEVFRKWEPEKPITLQTIVEDFSKYKKTTDSNLTDLEDAVLELGEIIGGM